jgi:hypothetical protein
METGVRERGRLKIVSMKMIHKQMMRVNKISKEVAVDNDSEGEIEEGQHRRINKKKEGG